MLAKKLRREQTDAEQVLWNIFRELRNSGIRFRRQHPVGEYIVDFINLEKKLIIEVDGGQHNEELMRRKEEKRTLWLESEGYKVFRFWNNDVLENREGVFHIIQEVLNK